MVADSGRRTVPALRETLMDYKQLTPLLSLAAEDEPPALQDLRGNVGDVLDAYQASRYGFAARRLPLVLADAVAASRAYSGHEAEKPTRCSLSPTTGRPWCWASWESPSWHGSPRTGAWQQRSPAAAARLRVRSSEQSRTASWPLGASQPRSSW
ncbi:hypothetical protein GCM10023238_06020 [Streptomyces heliomycini]